MWQIQLPKNNCLNMKDYLKQSIILYTILILALIGGVYETVTSFQKTQAVAAKFDGNFTQPPLKAGVYPWSIRSVDTQVVSKHWPNVTRSAISEQVGLIAELGVNYVAIGTPYDRIDEMRLWAEEIHERGLNVWFRSHWAEWEGDDGKPATLSADEYLRRTGLFIKNNPDLFMPGDAFTVAVEPEQVGIGLGKRFLTWDQYRNFLLSQITLANDAFESIDLKGKIYTNWISVNGWVVDNQFNQELVDKMGLITVDHFVGQSKTIGDVADTKQVITQTMNDLDRYNTRWNVPILLGEWGYQIFQNVPDDLQTQVVEELLSELVNRKYIVGINYWVHMGNSASLIGDQYGSNLKYRPAAYVLKAYYDPLSSKPTTPSTKRSNKTR